MKALGQAAAARGVSAVRRAGELAGQGAGGTRQVFVQRTDEPRFGHDSTFPYAHVMILKQTLEAAGVADRAKVADAIRKIRQQGPPRGRTAE